MGIVESMGFCARYNGGISNQTAATWQRYVQYNERAWLFC